MNASMKILTLSQWTADVRSVFRHSPTAFSEFARNPVHALADIGFDDNVQLDDGAQVKVSSLLAGLSPLELNQLVESVRPETYRAGDGGGGDGGSCGPGDCSDPSESEAGVVSAVAVVTNVAVVSEVVAVATAVTVVVYGGSFQIDPSASLSPATAVELTDQFISSDLNSHLGLSGLSDVRKRALIKARLIESGVDQGRLETEMLGRKAWLALARQEGTVRVTAGGLI